MNNPKVHQYGLVVVVLVTGRALKAFWSNWVRWDTLLVLTQGGRGGGYLGWPVLQLVTLSRWDPACSCGPCDGGGTDGVSLTSFKSEMGSWFIAVL